MVGSVVVCAVGFKGAVFLDCLLERHVRVDRITSYDQPGDRSKGFERIRARAAAEGIDFATTRRPDLVSGELVFLVGWQYLLAENPEATLIVFHDSLLPKYRGFAPTVAALIKGEPEIGVTALLPVAGVDEGPIVAQARLPVRYPITIAQALERQARLMGELAEELVVRWQQGHLKSKEQDHAAATYSLWRDDHDYMIDWTASAEEIARMIDATGHPYEGARTTAGGQTIIVDRSSVLDDLDFVFRTPGKIWRIDNGRPIVVCGSGLLRLDQCRTMSGEAFSLRIVRIRLG